MSPDPSNKKSLNSICFLVPYFGKLPPYFPLFLNSVAGQPFNIIFFTDIDPGQQLPENIIWHNTSLAWVEKLCKESLNIEVKIENPHKLCDFKPAYGLIFEQFIAGYDFWGTIDIDTVVGNFSKYFPAHQLAETDFFSGIEGYVSGSMFFIRNNSFCNNLFKTSKDWAKAFTAKKYVGFDECGGKYFSQLQAGATIFDLNTPIQSFTEVILLAKDKGLRPVFQNYILEPRGSMPVLINNGIFYTGAEHLLLHFIYFKTTYFFYINPSVLPAPYYINSLGTFKNKPGMLNMLFSYNMLVAVQNKVKKNWRKLVRMFLTLKQILPY